MQFTSSFVIELAFSFLVGAATTLRTTMFMIGLILGKSVIWSGQARDAHALSWSTAAAGLWPQTLFGSTVIALLAWKAPTALWWGLPLLAGFPLAIPFAVATASPVFGRFLARWRILRHPGRDRYAAGGSGPRGHHCNAVVQGGLTGDGLARAVCHGSSVMALDPDLSSRP